MIREDRRRVIRGFVRYEGEWVPIERKLAGQRRDRKRIRDGMVYFQGGWVSMEEKVRRVTGGPAVQVDADSVVVEKTVYRIRRSPTGRRPTSGEGGGSTGEGRQV